MKFMDIATQNEVAVKFLTVNGVVEMDRFVKWWFMDYMKIIETVMGGTSSGEQKK